MAPKVNKTAATAGDDDGDKGFRWTAENDKKLLMLMVGRDHSTAETHELVKKWPGSSYNGIRIRVSKLRREAEKYIEEMGFAAGVPPALNPPASGPATPKNSRGKKRAAKADDGPVDDEEDTGILKRARSSKSKAKKEIKSDEEQEAGVKEEQQEDDTFA